MHVKGPFVCVCLSSLQSYGEDILASLRELEVALSEAAPVDQSEVNLSSSLHQECLYYLNTYGTHVALISFYMRHDCMTEAVTHLLNKVRVVKKKRQTGVIFWQNQTQK